MRENNYHCQEIFGSQAPKYRFGGLPPEFPQSLSSSVVQVFPKLKSEKSKSENQYPSDSAFSHFFSHKAIEVEGILGAGPQIS